MQRQKIQKNTGFTLVEMLVAIAVFMSVMVVAVGALMSIINANKKNQAIKSVVDNVTFALDNISRDMRSGTNYSCSTDGGINYIGNCSGAGGGNSVRYKSGDGTATIYYKFVSNPAFGYGNIQKCTDSGSGCVSWQSMTAPTSTVNITNTIFYVLGTGDVTKQPRVLITTEGKIATRKGIASFTLQSTVSQRSR